MRTYHVTLTGISPLLLHHDDITFQDELKLWRTDPDNKKNSVPGDDRSPAFTWLGCLYHDDGLLTIPSENIMKCLTEAGAMVPVPGGKNGKTFKAQTQSGDMHRPGHHVTFKGLPNETYPYSTICLPQGCLRRIV